MTTSQPLVRLVQMLRNSRRLRLHQLEMASKWLQRHDERLDHLLRAQERERAGGLDESDTDRPWNHLPESTGSTEPARSPQRGLRGRPRVVHSKGQSDLHHHRMRPVGDDAVRVLHYVRTHTFAALSTITNAGRHFERGELFGADRDKLNLSSFKLWFS